MEPMRRVTTEAPPRPTLSIVEGGPVKPVQTRAIRETRRRRWRVGLTGVAAFLLIALPMALHGIWGVTGSAVLTDSMQPYINAGDLIVTRPVLATDIRPGDIAVLDVPGHSLLAHRVISATTDSGTVEITTQGDANPQADPSVTVDADREIAVVLFRVPAAGYVANFFMQPAVLTAGLGLLLLGNILTVVLVLYPRSTVDRGTRKGGGA